MPKFKILGRLDAERIPAAVPPDYRERARMAVRAGGVYTVVLFAHERDGGVTTSAAIRRALGRVAAEERVVAVGRDFTSEATALLEARDAAIVRVGEFGWTDASYHSLPR